MGLFRSVYKYNLGYALSGGGAKGFAHLGALKGLESAGLKPDVIVGTSAGALAGVFYADGYSPEEIADMFKGLEFRQFAEFTRPRAGFFKSAGLRSFIKNNLRAKSFEDLKMPFITVATDWNRARTVTFSKGRLLVDAVVASCSVPVIFYPQLINDTLYVDGGLLKNFPVSVIRKNTRYIVGVNVSLMIPPHVKSNVKNMAERTFSIMSNSNTLLDRKLCDILIEAKGVEKYSLFDLNHIDLISEIGYQSALEKLHEVKVQDVIRKYRKHQLILSKLNVKR